MFASLRNLLWPKQRRRTVELTLAHPMGTLSQLPEDVFTARVACYFPSKQEYLDLRVASKGMRDLTERAIASRSSCCRGVPTECHFKADTRAVPPEALARTESGEIIIWETSKPIEMRASTRHVAAMARVFAAGCRTLRAAGRREKRIAALDIFVALTDGGLTALDLRYSKVSPEMLLRMCRASPKLTSLHGPMYVSTPESTIVAISVACPNLEVVDFSYMGRESLPAPALSPAETWARHFPRLKTIVFENGVFLEYQPTCIDGIRATALVTNASKLRFDSCHITRDVIDAIVGTPLGDRIETLGEVDKGNEAKLEPEALLAAARGFPRLAELHVPKGSTMDGPQFYEQLKRAAPQLRTLHICDHSTTADCVAAACDMRLERLHLDRLYDHGDRHILDEIIDSEASQTLEALDLHYISEGVGFELCVRAADVLRVVRACPRLKRLSWWVVDDGEYDEDDRRVLDPDHETYQAIRELLVSRGGIDDWPDRAFEYKRWTGS